MQHFAIETDHVFHAQKRLYILKAPDRNMAQEMVSMIIENESGRFISDSGTLDSVAGIACVYIEVEVEDDAFRAKKQSGSRSGSEQRPRLRSAGRANRKKRISIWKRDGSIDKT